jgi:uncharacterized damage-inducible protein DinB
MKREEYIDELNSTFSGKPWHGKSLLKQLEDVDSEIVAFRPSPGNHNIAEIVKHIVLWREFVIEKLKGNEAFNLEFGSPDEWPSINFCSNKEFKKMKEDLVQSQDKLVLEIKNFKTETNESVPGRNYPFSSMLSGIIYHDVYHAGQIGLIKSIFKRQHGL